MFKCGRCGTVLSNAEAKGLETCPHCHEDGVASPLAFSLLAADGRMSGAVERCRRAFQGLAGRTDLPAPSGRSTDISREGR